MDIFTLKNTNGLTMRYSPKTCELSLEFADRTVNFSNEKPYIDIFAFGKTFRLELTLARKIHIEEIRTTVGSGIRVVYENFYAFGKKLSLSVDTLISINNNDNFVSFEIDVKNDENSEIHKIIWPQPVEFNDSDSTAYTVIPSLQGALIPSKWHNTFMLYGNGRYNECDCCMPWWGQYFDGIGYISVADTPWDGGFDLQHIPGKKTRISNCWYPSLRKMSYRRKHKMLFAENLDYNMMCRTYRQLMIENGSFVSLEEKVHRKPKTLNYIGVPFISDYMLVSADESSPRYDENPLFYITAKERAQQLAKLKILGLEKACIHFDGCNRYGYDNGHPDIFPPSDIIGGINGVKYLLNECHRLGYTLNLHDQYRDYYVNAPSYNPQLAIEDADNNIIKESVNYGGTQTFLCPENIMPFLKRNYELFYKGGIVVDGIHLGAFSGSPIDECYSPLHPMSRRECIEKRRDAFRYLTSKGYVVSSDEPVDCMIGEIEMVAQATYSLIPSMTNGISNGLSVPLFNLVYHDAVIMPWCMPFENVGWWGIPNTDSPYVHAFLNASPFGLSMPDEQRVKSLLPKLNKLCLLHKKLAFTPMIKHEFSGNNPRVQRTYFEDGTIIEVDFDSSRTDIISSSHSNSNIPFRMHVR